MSQNEIINVRKASKSGYYIITLSTLKDNKPIEYTISDDVIVKYSLLKGKVLTNEELQNILKENDINDYFLKACHYISFKMRSEKEIREYLEKYTLNTNSINTNSINTNSINTIISMLKTLKYVDDDIYAKLLLSSVISKLKGPRIYKQKLSEKGIKINDSYNDEMEDETLINALEKIKDTYQEYPISKQKQLIIDKLLRDGFSQTKVYRILDNIALVDNSSNKLEREIEKLIRKYQDIPKNERDRKIITNLLAKGYTYQSIKELIKQYS